jgi:hypothetical protein
MTKDNPLESNAPSTSVSELLRQQAEDVAGANAEGSSESLETTSPEVMRQMLHELRVHQIELEMQNEELRRA